MASHTTTVYPATSADLLVVDDLDEVINLDVFVLNHISDYTYPEPEPEDLEEKHYQKCLKYAEIFSDYERLSKLDRDELVEIVHIERQNILEQQFTKRLHNRFRRRRERTFFDFHDRMCYENDCRGWDPRFSCCDCGYHEDIMWLFNKSTVYDILDPKHFDIFCTSVAYSV